MSGQWTAVTEKPVTLVVGGSDDFGILSFGLRKSGSNGGKYVLI